MRNLTSLNLRGELPGMNTQGTHVTAATGRGYLCVLADRVGCPAVSPISAGQPTLEQGGGSAIATRRDRGPKWMAATRPYRLAWAAMNAPCALCHKPINYTLHRNHRESLTVDHIVPLMNDGAMFDPSNWQAAHRGCNSSKGNVDRTARDRTARQAHHSWRW